MHISIKRVSKYSDKVNKYIQQSNKVVVSRMYDSTLLQITDNILINIETYEVITDKMYEVEDTNMFIKAIKNTVAYTNDKIKSGLYQCVGPGIGINWDGFSENTLMPFDDSRFNFEGGDINRLRKTIIDRGWYGVIITACKGNLVRVYLLDRQFFGIEYIKNKVQKQVINNLIEKIKRKVKLDEVSISNIVEELTSNHVIYNYITSGGHADEFIDMIVAEIKRGRRRGRL